MAQHVGIARGRYGRLRILLLDEPFSAVDAFTRWHLQDLVISLVARYDIGVWLVIHDLDEAFYLVDWVMVPDGEPSPIQRRLGASARPRPPKPMMNCSGYGPGLTLLWHMDIPNLSYQKL